MGIPGKGRAGDVPASGQSPRLVTDDVNHGGGGGGGDGRGGDSFVVGGVGGGDDGMLPTNFSPFRSLSAIAVMQVPPFLSSAKSAAHNPS